MNAKFGISTQMLSKKKVVSYPRLKQKVFFVDLCYLSATCHVTPSNCLHFCPDKMLSSSH